MNGRILLLEDDIEGRDILELFLQEAGYEVIGVTHGSQALSLLRQMAFELLIIDGLLPDTNGVQFLSEVRQMGVNTGVIMLTGHEFFNQDPQTRHLLEEVLGAVVLRKPATPEQLLYHVHRVRANMCKA